MNNRDLKTLEGVEYNFTNQNFFALCKDDIDTFIVNDGATPIGGGVCPACENELLVYAHEDTKLTDVDHGPCPFCGKGLDISVSSDVQVEL